MRNQNGFALVESVSTLLFAMIALTAGFVLVYTAFAHQWLKHAAYETSICLSTPARTQTCEQDLRDSTAKALPIGKLENVYLSRTRTNVKTQFRWRLNDAIALGIDDVRSVPLLGKI